MTANKAKKAIKARKVNTLHLSPSWPIWPCWLFWPNNERGASLIAVTSTFALIISLLAGGIFSSNVIFHRQVNASQSRAVNQEQAKAVINQTSWRICELATTPLTGITLDQLVHEISSTIPNWTMTLEDESAKLNLHTMTYALPYALNYVGGLTFPQSVQSAVFITALAEAQGMWVAQTRGFPGVQSPVSYPWRPPAAYTLAVEPRNPPPPYDQSENRHFLWGQFGTLPPWQPLESPEDLFLFTEDSTVKTAIETVLPFLTTAPTIGLNINTCTNEQLLLAILSWQRDAPLGHPRYTQAYDAMMFDKPPTLPDPPVLQQLQQFRAGLEQANIELQYYLLTPNLFTQEIDNLQNYYIPYLQGEITNLENTPPVTPARAYSNMTQRLYTSSGIQLTLPSSQTTENLLAAQFRNFRAPMTHPIPASALTTIFAGRPYAQSEILQLLAVQSFLFPFSHEWTHLSGPVTEAVHFKLKGPGPYTASSTGYFKFHLTGGANDILAIVKVRSDQPPKIVRWEVN